MKVSERESFFGGVKDRVNNFLSEQPSTINESHSETSDSQNEDREWILEGEDAVYMKQFFEKGCDCHRRCEP